MGRACHPRYDDAKQRVARPAGGEITRSPEWGEAGPPAGATEELLRRYYAKFGIDKAAEVRAGRAS